VKRILVILGTRPEAIKMCPLIKELKKSDEIDLKVLSTGQHKSMLDEVLKIENIKVDYDLSLMKIGQTLAYLTSEIINLTGKIIDELLPDFVLVHGDTTTAFSGALAAFYKGVPICHVEAGLRTYDKSNPYPEEFNRCAISRMASYHFAPTEENKNNLIREGVEEENVFVTGNTVIDALKSNLKDKYEHKYLPKEEFVIFTAHRRENVASGMESIFRAVKDIANKCKIKILYPVHKNQKIRSLAEKVFKDSENVKTVPALRVDEFHNFLSRCKFVITDSGGVQEEASFFGKPVLITRKCTERKEILTISGIKLVGNDRKTIFEEAKKMIENYDYYQKNAVPTLVFGDGNASKKIALHIVDLLKIQRSDRMFSQHK